MLKFSRRCIVADESGQTHEFRVVTSLADGTLLLLPARRAEEIRHMASAEAVDSLEIFRQIREHYVALDPGTGRFLTQSELRSRLERGTGHPLVRFVAQTA